MSPFSQYLPDWLPEDPQKNQAARAGLLNFGAALLNGRGNLGGILGNGLVAGSQGYNADLHAQAAAEEAKQKLALQAAQTTQIGLDNRLKQGEIDEPEQLRKIMAGPPKMSASSSIGPPTSAQGLINNTAPQIQQQTPPEAQGPFDQSLAIPQDDPLADPMSNAASQAPDQSVRPAIMPVSALPTVGGKAPIAASSQAEQYQQAMTWATRLSDAGKTKQAKVYFDIAKELKPKFSTEFRVAKGPDGKLHNYFVAEDGTFKDSGLDVKPDMKSTDLGGKVIWQDLNAIAPGQTLDKGVTPGENLQHNDQVAARAQQDRHWKAEQDAAPEDVPMDPLAVHMTAQQYLAGDPGAMTNFGRGKQGSANLNAVRLEVAKIATANGMNGADIAAKMAEFAGLKAGQRTAGTRSASIEIAANEVAQLAPIALDASKKVARSGFLPFGKVQIMFDSNSNNPDMRQFAMANTALVNAYGQAMARNGTATVSDKDHAREMLSTAFDQKSYTAAVEQLQKETRAAQAAPKQVRKDLSDAVAGREPQPATSHPSAPAHPPEINNLLKKYGGH